jgi:hypothetical protein
VTDLDALRVLLASSWLLRSTGALVERPTISQFFELRVGDLAVDLRHQLPFDLARWPFRLTLLRDGWRIDQICQYRALVYYAAFANPDIMRQLAISLRSLIEFGRYDGPIVLLTDHKPADLAQFVPAEHLARLALLPVRPSDPPGYMTARYLLLDWADARLFQPVLYVDTDIVFDNDVTPMLRAIALSDRIAAPVELMSTLAGQPSVGATLLQRDLCAPGFMAGFNSGTLGIPNLHEHAAMLRLIRRLIVNHSLLYGRTTLPYADQEIANYVSYRIGHFDTALLSRFVRYAGHDAHLGSRSGLRSSSCFKLAPAALEEFLHLGEEALAFGAAFAVSLRLCLELFEQFALPARQVLRRFHRHLNIHIAARRAPQHGKTLAAQAELFPGLRPRWDLDLRLGAVDRRHLDIAAECRLRHAQRHPHKDIGPVALEHRMRPDRHMHV